MTDKWLQVIGLSEGDIENIASLPPSLFQSLKGAKLIIGARRHLKALNAYFPATATVTSWQSPLLKTLDEIEKYANKSVCVLATGDPMQYGIGTSLIKKFGHDAVHVTPAVGAFSLAYARMGWRMDDCKPLTLHGRAIEKLSPHLYPHAKWLVLADDKYSYQHIARYLHDKGFKDASITVLSNMGGVHEKAAFFANTEQAINNQHHNNIDDFNTIAVNLKEQYTPQSQDEGLKPPLIGHSLYDDNLYHDKQITKQQVRAITMMNLRPYPGAHLWDLGAGCGSISCAWAQMGGSVDAVESKPHRLKMLEKNSHHLGFNDKITAHLSPMESFNFDNIPRPTSIFFGGGITTPDMAIKLFEYLKVGGMFVANSVTIEGQIYLQKLQEKWGGDIINIRIEKLEILGKYRGFKPSMAVQQFYVEKKAHHSK